MPSADHSRAMTKVLRTLRGAAEMPRHYCFSDAEISLKEAPPRAEKEKKYTLKRMEKI